MKKRAAVGFRVHSGWTTLVALSLDGKAPVVLRRERVHLVKTFDFKFRQPYHTAEKLPLEEARKFVAQIAREARGLALNALRDVEATLARDGYQLARSALLLASGRPLPAFEKILASHALIHTADGELFRDAIAQASARRKLPVFVEREKVLLERAAKELDAAKDILLARATKLGKPFGSPWSQDEKFATLIAWLSLNHR